MGSSRLCVGERRDRGAIHEALVELGGVFGVALGKDLCAEVAASLGVEDTFCLEARKGVSVEDLRPFVAVVAGGVACRATEKVAEVEDIALSLGLVFGVVVLKHVFNK